MHMIKTAKTFKRIIIYDLLKQCRENVLQGLKIKVRLVLNKTLNYIQHMILPVPYRLFLTSWLTVIFSFSCNIFKRHLLQDH